MPATPAPRNRTVRLTDRERRSLKRRLLHIDRPAEVKGLLDRVIHDDMMKVVPYFPTSFVDLLVLDPPYNLRKSYNGSTFQAKKAESYERWFEDRLAVLLPLLRMTASIYICSDWPTSSIIHRVLERHTIVRNRITWEREKGRGASNNWKNSMEDIWFCTMSNDYHFDLEAVKIRRKVIAPYKTNGKPKDWEETAHGNYRTTHPGNFWNDITVPFWSMPENTDHPTQKPEKLIAKLVLASSKPGAVVLDPFCGSGTTCVVAAKLGRTYVGIEIDEYYACLTQKRVEAVQENTRIQGYAGGIFWERNSEPR